MNFICRTGTVQRRYSHRFVPTRVKPIICQTIYAREKDGNDARHHDNDEMAIGQLS